MKSLLARAMRCSLVILVAWMAVSIAPGAAPSQRPNIILFLADDMGFADLGCYGSEISTPNIDRLAAGGIRFTQFYNCARCCPTRASLLTGLYPHQAGVGHMVTRHGQPTQHKGFPAYYGDLSQHAVTVAEALRAAGYHTAMVGKWHVTPVIECKDNWPLQRGFEKFYGIIHGAASYFDPSGILVRDNAMVQPEAKDYYLTDALGDNAIGYLEQLRKEKKPFFLYVAFTAPHYPLHARPEDIAKYWGKYSNNWEELRASRYRRQIEMGLIDQQWLRSPRDVQESPWNDPQYKEWQGLRMAVYAAQVERLDRNVGRIMAKLKQMGAEDNTLVLLLSDNGGCAEEIKAKSTGTSPVPAKAPDGGPMHQGNTPEVAPGTADTYSSYGQAWANVSNTPFRYYKHYVHEGGIATPLIAYWPSRIKRASINSQMGHVMDFMPTFLELAGTAYPKEFNGQAITPLEGKSLVPILEGKPYQGHEAIFWEHEGNCALRQGKWKLVSRYPGKWELYDMERDRTELRDLAVQEPAKLEELKKLYQAMAARCGVEPWDKVK